MALQINIFAKNPKCPQNHSLGVCSQNRLAVRPAGSSALDPAEYLVRKLDHSELFSKLILSLKTLSMKSKIFSCGSVNKIYQSKCPT